MHVVDLFAGSGGLSLGFKMAGFETDLAIDNCYDCSLSYLHNFPESQYIVKDIRDVTRDEIFNSIKNRVIDGVIGGPPCQGFSVSGKRVYLDPRNSLYREYLRILDFLNPTFCLLENVPGLKQLYGGEALKTIICELRRRDYEVSYSVLSADHFGVPQRRKRLFIVAMRGIPFRFPQKTAERYTLGDAISDLPNQENGDSCTEYKSSPKNPYQERMRGKMSNVFNNDITKHSDKTKEIISLVPEGGNYRNLPEELAKTRKVHIAWTRLDSTKSCTTIDTGHRHHFHPWENRVLTVRESARVQSFPDNFMFLGSKTSQYRQVGNAVPPLLAYHIALAIKEAKYGAVRGAEQILF